MTSKQPCCLDGQNEDAKEHVKSQSEWLHQGSKGERARGKYFLFQGPNLNSLCGLASLV